MPVQLASLESSRPRESLETCGVSLALRTLDHFYGSAPVFQSPKAATRPREPTRRRGLIKWRFLWLVISARQLGKILPKPGSFEETQVKVRVRDSSSRDTTLARSPSASRSL